MSGCKGLLLTDEVSGFFSGEIGMDVFLHTFSFALTMGILVLLAWHANRGKSKPPSVRVLSAPFVTKLLSVAVVGIALFLVPAISENALQIFIGYAVVALGFIGCISFLTTQIIVTNDAIRQSSIFVIRIIRWEDVEIVRASRIDAGYVVIALDGTRIKVHYLFKGAVQLEEEIQSRIAKS